MSMDPTRMRDASFGSDRLDSLLTRIEMEERGEDGGPMLSPLLLAHPDDEPYSEDDHTSGNSRLVGGGDYVRQNMRMAACFITLLLGYSIQRTACKAGLPYDCLLSISYLEFFSDITSLSLYGLALGWFIGIAERSRFSWLFNRKRWYAALAFFLTPPIYSAISNVDTLKHDLTDLSSWSAPFIVVWLVAMSALATVIGWHILLTWRSVDSTSFVIYVTTRLVMFLWFASSAVVLARGTPPVHIHLHHLYLGWGLALWADVNEPLSAVTLAVGAGIFVQGVGAYSFAPVFSPLGCFETPAAAELKCKFWAAEPFTLQVCGSGGAAAEHTCQVGGGGGGGGGM